MTSSQTGLTATYLILIAENFVKLGNILQFILSQQQLNLYAVVHVVNIQWPMTVREKKREHETTSVWLKRWSHKERHCINSGCDLLPVTDEEDNMVLRLKSFYRVQATTAVEKQHILYL